MKRFTILGVLFFALVALIPLSAQQQPFKGKTLTILALSDEFKTNKVIGDFEKLTGATVDLQIVPNEQYLNKLKPLLKTGRAVPDIFMGEAGYIQDVVNLGMSEDLSKAPYNANVSDLYPYAVKMGEDKKGVLRAMTWQCTPGGLFYRRSLAKKYLGSDDPAVVQKAFASWDKMLETGRLLAEKSQGKVKLIPTALDLGNIFFAAKKIPYINDKNEFQIDPVLYDYFKTAKAVRDQNLEAKLSAWAAPWMEGMNTKPGEATIFTYVWPTWGLFYIMNNQKNSIGDWAVVHAPISFYWGGTWLNIYKASPNKELAWAFIKMLTQDKTYMEAYARRVGDFLADKTVDKKVTPDMKSPILAGQNHFAFFSQAADQIDASGVSASDTVINAQVAAVLAEYLDGKRGLNESMTELKARVKQQFPRVIVK